MYRRSKRAERHGPYATRRYAHPPRNRATPESRVVSHLQAGLDSVTDTESASHIEILDMPPCSTPVEDYQDLNFLPTISFIESGNEDSDNNSSSDSDPGDEKLYPSCSFSTKNLPRIFETL